MIMQDRLEKERNDAKNNVEEYVYDMRDKLHGMLEKFVSESVSKPHFFLLRYAIVELTAHFIYLIWVDWSCLCAAQDRDALSLKLEDTENWLYEDGEDQPKQMYIDKLAELKVIWLFICVDVFPFLSLLTCNCHCLQKLGQPIMERYTEAEERPKAFEEMGRQIQQYMKFVEAYKMKVKPEYPFSLWWHKIKPAWSRC